jgi:hypothetical protein
MPPTDSGFRLWDGTFQFSGHFIINLTRSTFSIWGSLSCALSAVKTPGQLYAIRFLQALAESSTVRLRHQSPSTLSTPLILIPSFRALIGYLGRGTKTRSLESVRKHIHYS